MSVVVWDGETLAADRQEVCGTTKRSTRKIYKVNDVLLGEVGSSVRGAELRAWYIAGANPKDFKYLTSQDDYENGAQLIVVKKNGQILEYSNSPHPCIARGKKQAWGCGSQIAMAGMKLGLNAKDAVKLACSLDAFCGMGQDTLSFL